LHRIKLLTVVDVGLMAAYCSAFARWKAAEEALAREAEADPDSAGLTVPDAHGTPRLNPLVRIARNAAQLMLHCASQLGCTPTARARLAAGIGGQPPGPSKFDGLIP
jgi:P27 family predicted phage terminase small subunit